MEHFLGIGIEICIYVILVLSANLTVGLAGMLTLCQAAFYGIGAFLGAILMINFNLPFIATAVVVMLATGAVSLLISYASIKLKGDYFILSTLCFQFIVFSIIYNMLSEARNGVSSLSSIPPIRLLIFGSLESRLPLFVFTLLLTLAIVWLIHRMQASPFGRALVSIRGDESSAQALGRNTDSLKTTAFFISAALSSLAGIIYASWQASISPNEFSLDTSILILTALFIGGIGRDIRGAIAGAFLIVILPELIMTVKLLEGIAAPLRQIIFGITLIVLMFMRPKGLIGDLDIK